MATVILVAELIGLGILITLLIRYEKQDTVRERHVRFATIALVAAGLLAALLYQFGMYESIALWLTVSPETVVVLTLLFLLLLLGIIFRQWTTAALRRGYAGTVRWLEQSYSNRRRRTGVLISIVVALMMYGIWQVHWFELLERKSLDWRYRTFRSQEKLRDDIVVLDIDERSVKVLEELYGRFPWPRDVHAAMLQYMQMAGAKCVAFDVLLSEPTQNPQVMSPTDGYVFNIYGPGALPNPDETLRTVTEITNFVHHAVEFTYQQHAQQTMVAASDKAIHRFGVAIPRVGNYHFETFYGATTPLPMLAEVSRGVGSMNMKADDDGPVRRAYTFLQYKDQVYPSISMSVMRQVAGTDTLPADVIFGNGKVDLANPVTGEVAYSVPIDENGIMNVNYYGDQRSYPYISYCDVIFDLYDYLTGKSDTPTIPLVDRIVVVGSSAAGLMDLRATPYSSIYPGVEVHTTLINNILESDYLRPEPEWTHLVIILALAGIMGIWVAPRRAVEGALLAMMLIIAYVLGASYAFQYLNLAMDMVSSIFFIGGNYIVLTGVGYLVEERKRKAITGAFSQYVNPAVVKEILKDPEKLRLGGEKVEITIFFSDLAGFTTISETLPPEELVNLLNDYLTAMTDIILEYEGTIDKYEGDAIMCFFGAPLPQPDHARRAVWAALDSLSTLDRLREEWVAQGYPLLDARIGLNTGEAVVGNMGSRTTKNYTAMGDTINLGARLEPANKPYGTRLMISEYTFAEAKDHIEARRLDALIVKGKTKPVIVYEPLAKKGELTPAQRALLQHYNTGMESYLDRRWQDGIDAFTAALAAAPEDGPAKVYLDRCRQYLAEPPGDDWSGVFELTTK